MSLGIYKQGQGYWVRVLTAALIAVLTLGAAGWMADQTSRFEANLPRSTFAFILDRTSGAITPGETVTLVAKPELPGAEAKQIGTARVASYDAANEELRITDASITVAELDPTSAATIKTANFAAGIRTARGVPPIEPRLLIGIVVGIVLLLGSGLAYYFAGVRQGAVDFLIATDMEMKKVHWSSWKEIRGSTAVVIFACVIIAGFLFSIDLIFQWFFRFIGILVDAG
jgi:preprotein translocase SecE subunit